MLKCPQCEGEIVMQRLTVSTYTLFDSSGILGGIARTWIPICDEADEEKLKYFCRSCGRIYPPEMIKNFMNPIPTGIEESAVSSDIQPAIAPPVAAAPEDSFTPLDEARLFLAGLHHFTDELSIPPGWRIGE